MHLEAPQLINAVGKKANYIPTLDGIRAVAIAIVIASHEITGWSALGRSGVLLFFALSGYLITWRLLQEYRREGLISLRNFYIRRAFRILPPVIVYLGIVAALGAANAPSIRAALLFYINYLNLDATAWKVGHFWSLSVEEHFYLLWPALLIGLGVARGWQTAAVLAVGVSVWRILDNRHEWIAHVFNAPYLTASEYRTDLIADALFWGCSLAFIPRNLTLPWGAGVILSAGALAFLGVLIALSALGIPHVTMVVDFLPALVVGCIIFVPHLPLGRFLEWAPMRFIGRLSYSLYIWQQLFVGTIIPPLALLAIFVCAYVSYRWIEQPSIRFGRRWVDGRVWKAPKATHAG
jgi:peptidoglycan/LPS O-acetylase OafA/YrhL